MKVELLYRDGCNYKFYTSLTLSEILVEKIEKRQGEKIRVGTEIYYDKDLKLNKSQFHDEVVGYKYDKESDHNILEVVAILKKNQPTQFEA